MKQALVTGPGGGVGRALLARLQRRGVRIAGVGRGETAPAGCARYWSADITTVSWAELLEGCDTVFHLAAFVHRRPQSDAEVARLHAVNHEATARLAQAALASGCKLVFASTVAVLGPGGSRLNDGTAPAPATEYGRSKLAAEEAIRALGRSGLRHAILRFPLLYGPHGRGNLERMLEAIRRGRYWPIGGDGTRKSCLHFDDAAEALVLAADKVTSGAYLVAPPVSPGLREIHEQAYRAVGKRCPWPPIPGPLAVAAAAGLRGVRRSSQLGDQIATLTRPAWYDGRRFAAETGFRPHVTLAEGLAGTAAWLQSTGAGA